MSSIYLIRHGQAGRRQSYDELSQIGRAQAAFLGEYLASQELRFRAIYSGTLARQRDTARAVIEKGVNCPELIFDTNWNEFDLDEVYRGLAPQLCREDPLFRTSYEEMTREMADENSAIHHTWTPCDTAVVRAWVAGRHEFEGESFEQFRKRVRRAIGALPECGREENIAVFTSATPIAAWVGAALELDGRKIMQLAGLMYNTAISVLRTGKDEPRLFSFNGIPHLADASLRSFR
ncbi:MAG: histidine phosphatase family protein [Acidobacteriota bacterium]|nr:histidine phosphatase family protein [Acidobacteriota bacterium]